MQRPASDMDVLVVTTNEFSENDADYISDCAWESGFERGIVVVPVIFSMEEWENGCTIGTRFLPAP